MIPFWWRLGGLYNTFWRRVICTTCTIIIGNLLVHDAILLPMYSRYTHILSSQSVFLFSFFGTRKGVLFVVLFRLMTAKARRNSKDRRKQTSKPSSPIQSPDLDWLKPPCSNQLPNGNITWLGHAVLFVSVIPNPPCFDNSIPRSSFLSFP